MRRHFRELYGKFQEFTQKFTAQIESDWISSMFKKLRKSAGGHWIFIPTSPYSSTFPQKVYSVREEEPCQSPSRVYRVQKPSLDSLVGPWYPLNIAFTSKHDVSSGEVDDFNVGWRRQASSSGSLIELGTDIGVARGVAFLKTEKAPMPEQQQLYAFQSSAHSDIYSFQACTLLWDNCKKQLN